MPPSLRPSPASAQATPDDEATIARAPGCTSPAPLPRPATAGERGSHEIVLLDGTPWPEQTWPVRNFRTGDHLSFQDDSGRCYEVLASSSSASGMWRLELRELERPDAPVLQLTLPRSVLARGQQMVRTLTASCFIGTCSTTTHLNVEVGGLGQARIKLFVCGKH